MKTRSTILLTGLVAAVLGGVPLLAQQGNGPGPRGGGGGAGGNALLLNYVLSLPLEQVSVAERVDLEHMRQEEKLARDVYTVLGQTWAIPAFTNIARSEQEHMDLVAVLLNRYGIADPLPSEAVGVYRDVVFRDLFLLLTNFGQQSLLHAEVVGAVIEDLDLADLQIALRVSDNRDIDAVWQNLARGSRNHLRSFGGMLAARGFTWPGIWLTWAQVQAIVTTPYETIPVDENGAPLR